MARLRSAWLGVAPGDLVDAHRFGPDGWRGPNSTRGRSLALSLKRSATRSTRRHVAGASERRPLRSAPPGVSCGYVGSRSARRSAPAGVAVRHLARDRSGLHGAGPADRVRPGAEATPFNKHRLTEGVEHTDGRRSPGRDSNPPCRGAAASASPAVGRRARQRGRRHRVHAAAASSFLARAWANIDRARSLQHHSSPPWPAAREGPAASRRPEAEAAAIARRRSRGITRRRVGRVPAAACCDAAAYARQRRAETLRRKRVAPSRAVTP